ncbi:MAG: PIN domain protein [Pyrinomonadaceae bacterium]
MFRVYFDNCAYNRPFDDQSGERVRRETAAVIRIQKEIEFGELDLIWSYINEGENFEHPFEDCKWAILRWKEIAETEISENGNLLKNAQKLMSLGLRVGDALHIAAAVEGRADFFITTNDKILKKVGTFLGVIVVDPQTMVEKLDEHTN